MKEIVRQLPERAKEKQRENRQFFAKLKKKPPKHLDVLMQELHQTAFREINCLQCANCCKTTGPLFTQTDIQRISKYLRLKPGRFIEQYLEVDEDNDYVLQQLPCTFLGPDNYCSIYPVRPKACSEFPHTNRKKFHQIGDLTLKNVAICPAAYSIVEAMKRKLSLK